MCHTVNDTHICINETFESTNNQIGIYVHETFKPCVREHLPYLHLTPRMTENSLFILPMLSLYISIMTSLLWHGMVALGRLYPGKLFKAFANQPKICRLVSENFYLFPSKIIKSYFSCNSNC